MKIIILGASGLIGQALVKQLESKYEITVVGRDLTKLKNTFTTIKNFATWAQLTPDFLSQFNAIINLAGENVGAKRWHKHQKEKILQSRITTTTQIANLCAALGRSAPKLLNASAIGIYGLQPSIAEQQSHYYDESSSLPNVDQDFLAQVGLQWENALNPAIENHVQVIKLRFGVVLATQGGVLAKLLPAFQFGMGSILGSGEQPFSWVSIDDVVNAIDFLLNQPDAAGAYNIVAPEVVTQKKFATVLAKKLHRPCFLVMPHFMVKILFGQMGEELLLNGHAVTSQRLAALGFQFTHPTLKSCLDHLFHTRS